LPLKPQMLLFLAQIKRIVAAAITQRSFALITSALHTHSVTQTNESVSFSPFFPLNRPLESKEKGVLLLLLLSTRACVCAPCVCVSNGVCKSRCPVDRNSRQLIKVRLLLSCPIISGLFRLTQLLLTCC
jgi:hypothetical protein